MAAAGATDAAGAETECLSSEGFPCRPTFCGANITRNVLSVERACREVCDDACGAITTIIGTVRSSSEGKRVTSLEYSSDEAAAQQAMETVAQQVVCGVCGAGVRHISIRHRWGAVPAGEASVIIAVSSEHRVEGFDAGHFAVQTLAPQFSTWRKEIFDEPMTSDALPCKPTVCVTRLTRDVLDVDQVTQEVMDDSCGSITLFLGTTRNNFEGKLVTRLEYDAYEPMALKELDKLARRAISSGVRHVSIWHRLGIVPNGESSVIIAVATEKRFKGIDACRIIMDELKANVPIWKKEIYSDGSAWKANKEWQGPVAAS